MIKPKFKDGFPFSKELFAVKMGKTKIKMPVYHGKAILDLRKTIMYKFHYEYRQFKGGSKV